MKFQILLLTAVPAVINAVRMSASENSKVVVEDEPPADDILLQLEKQPVTGSGLIQNKEICTGYNDGRCIEANELNERDQVAPAAPKYSVPSANLDL